jgi:hypothetical protein
MEGAEFWFSELVSNLIIWKNIFVAFTAKGFNFDEFKSAELHEKHRSSSLRIISAFAAHLSHTGARISRKAWNDVLSSKADILIAVWRRRHILKGICVNCFKVKEEDKIRYGCIYKKREQVTFSTRITVVTACSHRKVLPHNWLRNCSFMISLPFCKCTNTLKTSRHLPRNSVKLQGYIW